MAITCMASALVLAAPFCNFLSFQGYPILTPEVGMVSLGVVGLCFLMAIIHQGVRSWVQALLEGLLVLLAADLGGVPFSYAAVVAAAVTAFTLIKRCSSLPFLGMMALVTIAVGFLGIGQERKATAASSRTAAPAPSDAPTLLHLILDEHIGIEGLPTDEPAARSMKSDLEDFYLSRDFGLFGRAYSEHLYTVNAVPHMLNLGAPQPPDVSPKDGLVLAENAYFERLAELGYGIKVYQSDFIDYCSTVPVSSCERYPFDDLSLISEASLPVSDKAGLISVKFALLSRMARVMGGTYLKLRSRLNASGYSLPNLGLRLQGRASPINALAAFGRLTEALRHARPGEAYFAHILIPHDPYVTDPQCRLRETEHWMLRRAKEPRHQRDAAYFDQLRCVTSKVDDALQAISASAAGDNYIAVINGDHGSRITSAELTVENLGEFDGRDLITGHSALFAVRGPGLTPGYIEAPASVASLLSHLAQSGFTSLPKPETGTGSATVVLADNDWIPQRRTALPVTW